MSTQFVIEKFLTQVKKMNSNIRDVDGPSHSELVFITINISEEVDQDDFTDETKKLLVDFKKKAQNFCFLMENGHFLQTWMRKK